MKKKHNICHCPQEKRFFALREGLGQKVTELYFFTPTRQCHKWGGIRRIVKKKYQRKKKLF